MHMVIVDVDCSFERSVMDSATLAALIVLFAVICDRGVDRGEGLDHWGERKAR